MNNEWRYSKVSRSFKFLVVLFITVLFTLFLVFSPVVQNTITLCVPATIFLASLAFLVYVIIDYSKLMLVELEVNHEILRLGLKKAKNSDLKIIFNEDGSLEKITYHDITYAGLGQFGVYMVQRIDYSIDVKLYEVLFLSEPEEKNLFVFCEHSKSGDLLSVYRYS